MPRTAWLVAVLALLGAGAHLYSREAAQPKQAQAAPPAPVAAARVESGDVPIELVELGQVSAFNTVTVRALVGGQVQRIAFADGQEVKQGDGLLLVGVLAYFKLLIAPLPTVDVATILVTAELNGADPQTNAFAVTNPLEKTFGQIPGLAQLTSSSANSYAEITLQFGFNRTADSAAGDVQSAIQAASAFLPAQPPTYRKTNPASTPVLILALTPTRCR